MKKIQSQQPQQHPQPNNPFDGSTTRQPQRGEVTPNSSVGRPPQERIGAAVPPLVESRQTTPRSQHKGSRQSSPRPQHGGARQTTPRSHHPQQGVGNTAPTPPKVEGRPSTPLSQKPTNTRKSPPASRAHPPSPQTQATSKDEPIPQADDSTQGIVGNLSSYVSEERIIDVVVPPEISKDRAAIDQTQVVLDISDEDVGEPLRKPGTDSTTEGFGSVRSSFSSSHSKTVEPLSPARIQHERVTSEKEKRKAEQRETAIPVPSIMPGAIASYIASGKTPESYSFIQSDSRAFLPGISDVLPYVAPFSTPSPTSTSTSDEMEEGSSMEKRTALGEEEGKSTAAGVTARLHQRKAQRQENKERQTKAREDRRRRRSLELNEGRTSMRVCPHASDTTEVRRASLNSDSGILQDLQHRAPRKEECTTAATKIEYNKEEETTILIHEAARKKKQERRNEAAIDAEEKETEQEASMLTQARDSFSEWALTLWSPYS
eukprot:GHVQ01020593.1.p2 GENE.GHVQ01020593.1~~GHVQ01020593.1.p2  ORF type:complete len:489 (+),score=75.67 GHVQ01020593.1:538-2004(+)